MRHVARPFSITSVVFLSFFRLSVGVRHLFVIEDGTIHRGRYVAVARLVMFNCRIYLIFLVLLFGRLLNARPATRAPFLVNFLRCAKSGRHAFGFLNARDVIALGNSKIGLRLNLLISVGVRSGLIQDASIVTLGSFCFNVLVAFLVGMFLGGRVHAIGRIQNRLVIFRRASTLLRVFTFTFLRPVVVGLQGPKTLNRFSTGPYFIPCRTVRFCQCVQGRTVTPGAFCHLNCLLAQRAGPLSCERAKRASGRMIVVVLYPFRDCATGNVNSKGATMFRHELCLFFLQLDLCERATRTRGCPWGVHRASSVLLFLRALVLLIFHRRLFAYLSRPALAQLVFYGDFPWFAFIGIQPGNVARVGFDVDALPRRMIASTQLSSHTSGRVEVERGVDDRVHLCYLFHGF